MKNTYLIADIPIEIQADKGLYSKKLSKFKDLTGIAPELTIKFKESGCIQEPIGRKLLEERYVWFYNSNFDRYYVYKTNKDTNDIISLLEAERSFKVADIKYIRDNDDSIQTASEAFCEILFRNRLIFNKGLVMHAAGIAWGGKGILFTAPSGTGKTTQAKLWQRIMGAETLNDDRPAIRLHQNGIKIYGTPWSGSSSNFKNSQVELSAVFVIEQASFNEVTRLNPEQAVTRLVPRCFLPYHDRELMKIALTNLDRIIAEAPVYLLKCTPEVAAVGLVQKCLR